MRRGSEHPVGILLSVHFVFETTIQGMPETHTYYIVA